MDPRKHLGVARYDARPEERHPIPLESEALSEHRPRQDLAVLGHPVAKPAECPESNVRVEAHRARIVAARRADPTDTTTILSWRLDRLEIGS
jgi:hypothetical protein